MTDYVIHGRRRTCSTEATVEEKFHFIFEFQICRISPCIVPEFVLLQF